MTDAAVSFHAGVNTFYHHRQLAEIQLAPGFEHNDVAGVLRRGYSHRIATGHHDACVGTYQQRVGAQRVEPSVGRHDGERFAEFLMRRRVEGVQTEVHRPVGLQLVHSLLVAAVKEGAGYRHSCGFLEIGP